MNDGSWVRHVRDRDLRDMLSMNAVQRAVRTALVAILMVAAGLLLENVFITDPDVSIQLFF
jgi:hypothetical protein